MTGLKAAVLFSVLALGQCCNSSFYNWYQNYINNLNQATTTTTTTAKPAPSADCKCGVPNRVSRIVGGVEAEANEYPWQVGLTWSTTSRPFCGGSIASSKSIITAAHCIKGWESRTMYALVAEHDLTQSDGEKYVKICKKEIHSSYNTNTYDYDYAVLTLCEELTWADDVKPVCLPASSGQGTQYEAVSSVVSGWGTLQSNGATPSKLQEVTVQSMANTACCTSPYTAYSCGGITDRMICAADSGKDSCQGDSGGPMVANEGSHFTLTGIVSWGAGCAQDNAPGVYARVTNQLDWINARITGQTCERPQ
jgi:secreted trypsin-like serine protease